MDEEMPKKKKRYRSGKSTIGKPLAFYIHHEELEKLNELCDRLNQSRSAILRESLKIYQELFSNGIR